MVRPCKFRTVGIDPNHTYFKPRAIPLSELEEVELRLDELEAIKLADIDGLYHEDAAKKMNVSRQTFDRILIQAHRSVADALVNGKAILIKGGNIMVEDKRYFSCSDCDHSWGVAHGVGRPQECPTCKSRNVHRSPSDRGCSRRRVGGKGKCGRSGQKG